MSIRTEPEIAPRVVTDDRAESRETSSARRVVLALCLAGFAFLTAGVAALGPARGHRDIYTWPPPDQGAAAGGSRFAPLLLTRHHPERVTATVPCASLADAGTAVGDAPLTLLATARRSDAVDGRGLLVTLQQGDLVTRLADRALMRTPWPEPGDTGAACVLRMDFHESDWRVTSGGRVLGTGRERAPNVSGLYTDLPPRAGLRTVLDTGQVSSSPSTRQWALNAVAIVVGVAALVLLLRCGNRARARRSLRTRWLRLARAIAWIDVVVVGAMVVWWVVGPIFFDDGWVMTTVLNQPASGSFSVYYDHFGLPYPFVFLPLLMLYAFSRLSASLLWFRVPVLLIGILTWGMLRAYVGHLRSPKGRARQFPAVTLGAVFLVGWFAWLGTLRPEPFVAVLAALVILAVRRFHQSERLGDLAVAVIAAAAAVSMHPEGVVAIAPLAVAMPALYRWARERRWERWFALGTVALVASAVLTLLVFADTDLALFGDSRNVFATDLFHHYTWHDELYRYELVFAPGPYGTVARRASVLLALVPISLFLTRSDRRRNPNLDLPTLSLMLGVVALVFTPSKWPWQLGVLVPFAALSAAAELHRLLIEPASAARVRRLLLALGGSVLASMIAWRGQAFWSYFALMDVDFGRGGSGFLHVDMSSGVVWAFIVAGAALITGAVVVGSARRRRATLRQRAEAGLTALGAGALAVSAALIGATTLALFVVDGLRAPSWTLAKQNVDSVAGSTCGYADDLSVIDAVRGRALPVDDAANPNAAVDTLPLTAAFRPRLEFTPDGVDPGIRPVPGLESQWGSRVGSDANQGTFVSPWFNLDESIVGAGDNRGRLALFVAGRISGDDTNLFVQIGRQNGPDLENVAVAALPPQGDGPQWRPVLLDALVPVPPEADRLRLVAVDGADDRGGWLAFSSPRVVQPQPLAELLEEPGHRALIAPWMSPYFPCATQPRVEPGVSEPPDSVFGDVLTDAYPESPMRFLGDLYPTSQLLLVDHSGNPVAPFAVERVEKQLAPGTLVPATPRPD
jgi:arabinosyltransferase C